MMFSPNEIQTMTPAIHVRKLNLKFQSNLASTVVFIFTQFVMICAPKLSAFPKREAKFIQNIANIISQMKSIFPSRSDTITRKGGQVFPRLPSPGLDRKNSRRGNK